MSFQQDIIKINGTKIFINPFLYSKQLDYKSRKWLREFGQIDKSNIDKNRRKFYPKQDWGILSLEEKLVKDYTIELFLKTVELVRKSHPNLNYQELLEFEKQLIKHKKIQFEKRSRKYLVKKERILLKAKKKLEREDFFLNWKKWFYLKETKKLLLPIFVIIALSALMGWYAGISKNSCNPYFESFKVN